MLLSPLMRLPVPGVGMMIGSIGIGGVPRILVLHVLGGAPFHAVTPACPETARRLLLHGIGQAIISSVGPVARRPSGGMRTT